MAAVVLVIAAAFRLPLLDRRPMHADEAILADKVGTLLASGAYPYDPREYHGPVLAWLSWVPAHLTGRAAYAALTEATLRIVPALAGVALALAPLILPVPGSGAAALLIAVSPVMVYYSRYFIPEMLLALWTAVLLAAVLRRSWALAGAAAALMIGTKETAVLALAGVGIAYLAAFHPRPNVRAVASFLVLLVICISILIAPPWNWGTLAQSVAAYGQRGVTGGLHAHPWYRYLQWLAMTETPILILAAAGWRDAKPAVRFLVWYAAILCAIYSVIPYKTPWCALSILYPLALVAGAGIEGRCGRWRVLPAAVVVCLAVVAWIAAFPLASDPRNPWVYAHTGTGVFTIRGRVAEFVRASAEGPHVAIDIYTRENLWPLPWYLREFPNVRWWRDVTPPGAPAPIVLVSPALETEVARKIYEGPPPGERELYMNLFTNYVELRPGVEVRGYVAKRLWDREQAGAGRQPTGTDR